MQASLDTWTTLFLVVSFIGFFLAFLIIREKAQLKINYPIIILVIGFSLVLIQYVFVWSGYDQIYQYTYFFDHSWYLSVGPLLYNYVLKFHDQKSKTRWQHYIPAMVSFALNFYYYIRSDGYSKIYEFSIEILYRYFGSFRSPLLAIVSLLIYLIAISDIIFFVRNTKVLENEKRLQRKPIFVLGFYIIFVVAYLTHFILSKHAFFSGIWDYSITLTMAIAIYSIAWFVYKETVPSTS